MGARIHGVPFAYFSILRLQVHICRRRVGVARRAKATVERHSADQCSLEDTVDVPTNPYVNPPQPPLPHSYSISIPAFQTTTPTITRAFLAGTC